MLPTITVIGNINRLETKHTATGKQVTSFTIECSEKNSKGEWDNLYIDGEVWEKSSQFVQQYFKKGDVAIATGKLVTNSYQKQDGSKVYKNKFHFPQINFAPKAKDSQQNNAMGSNLQNNYQSNANTPQQQQNAPQAQQSVPVVDIDSDQIPF